MMDDNIELSMKEMILIFEALSIASDEALKENNLENEIKLTELRMKFIFAICERKLRDKGNE